MSNVTLRPVTLVHGNAIEQLPSLAAESVQCCVTSPPFWGLRDYGVSEQFGLEKSPEDYVANLVRAMREVRRVLKRDGTLWLNLGDCYATKPIGSGSSFDPKWPNARDRREGLRSNRTNSPSAIGLKHKDLVGIPWRVALALQADGWYLRSDIIWHKPNPMPESVKDRPTKAHEYLFLLTKSSRYFYDAAAVAEPLSEAMLREIAQGYRGSSTKDYKAAGAQDASATKSRILARYAAPAMPPSYKGSLPGRKDGPGQDRRSGNNRVHGNLPGRGDGGRACNDASQFTRNKRSVWTVTTRPFKGAHFATFPPKLIEPCILAGSREDDVVLDPFAGSGTTGEVALKHGRRAILIELNADYLPLIEKRCGIVKEELAA